MTSSSKNNDRDIIVRTAARTTIPLIGIFGTYVISHGHLTPGGGFQGGAIIAGGWILLTIAFGLNKTKTERIKKLYPALQGLAGLVFLTAAMLGISVAFFYNTLWYNGPIFNGEPGTHLSAGYVPIMDLAESLNVYAGIASAVFAIAIWRRWRR